jgi:predicted DNA-binding mobile mystery protein A
MLFNGDIYGNNLMVKQLVRDQYRSKIDQLVDFNVIRPKEGWIRSLRKALGMSSPQLAKRLNISRSQASQMERMEVEDRITLKQLRRVADSLGCDLVYALVPHKSVDDMVRDQARLKAQQLVSKTDVQMRLERQQLSREKLQDQIGFETERLMREMPRDLWDEGKNEKPVKVSYEQDVRFQPAAAIAEENVMYQTKNNLQIPRNVLNAICRRYQVRKLSLFGSAVRDDFKPDSDIDILVEFEPGQAPGFGGLVDLQNQLSDLFGGRDVDLATQSILNNPFRKKAVLKDLQTLYAA